MKRVCVVVGGLFITLEQSNGHAERSPGVVLLQ